MACRPIVAAAGLLILLASRIAAQAVLVVGTAPGPGIDFTSVQQAVDVAADGDVVLILPGSYLQSVVVQDRQLVLAGVAGPAGERPILASLLVRDLVAGRSVIVRGLQLAPFLVDHSLIVQQCAGPVFIEDCMAQGFSWSPIPQRVVDSEHVVLARCTLRGTPGGQFGTALDVDGSPALIVERSTVSLYDCDLAGGDGFDAFLFTAKFEATGGGPAVTMTDSTLVVAGCSLRGGQGGKGLETSQCLPPADGGDGLVVDGLLRRLDTSITSGAPGEPVGCAPAATAGTDVVVQDGTVLDIPQSPRHLALGSPVEPGGVAVVDVSGEPFEPILLLQALAPLGQWHGGLQGTLAGGPPYLVFALGFLGPEGTLHLEFPVPSTVLPAGVESLTIVDQLVSAAVGGGGLLSSPSTLELVADIP